MADLGFVSSLVTLFSELLWMLLVGFGRLWWPGWVCGWEKGPVLAADPSRQGMMPELVLQPPAGLEERGEGTQMPFCVK